MNQPVFAEGRFYFKPWQCFAGAAFICVCITVVLQLTNIHPPFQEVPMGYDGDSLAVLANLKAASEGGIHPFLPIRVKRLNAPFQAEWSDIPMSEFVFWLPSLLVPAFGLFQAANLFVLLALIGAGLAFYFSALSMGSKILPACVFGVLFGLAPYAFVRHLEHLMLTLYFVVPIYVYCVYKLWGREAQDLTKSQVCILCVLVLISSLFMPYYWAMFLVLLTFVTLGHLVNLSFRSIVFCGLVGVAALLGFLLQNLDTIFYQLAQGKNSYAFGRDLWWMVKFGLYLPDIIFPKFHQLPLIEFLTGKDYHWKIPEPLQGESQTAYIGVLPLTGLGLLIFRGLANASAGRQIKDPALFWFAIVTFCFAVVGGLNYLLGAFGFQFLRASNRYSIFLATIGLFYLSLLLSKWKIPKYGLAFVCGVILPLGLYDQIPKIPDWLASKRANAAKQFLSDQEFFPEMEKMLKHGSMVFQLPVHSYPEMGSVHEMGDYEHFRPYLHTSSLKFSYGGVRGREGFDWQSNLDFRNPLLVRKVLIEKGFQIILINRRAYLDRGAELKALFESIGSKEVMSNEDFFVFQIEDSLSQ
jgi:phosphoglycerol transferase